MLIQTQKTVFAVSDTTPQQHLGRVLDTVARRWGLKRSCFHHKGQTEFQNEWAWLLPQALEAAAALGAEGRKDRFSQASQRVRARCIVAEGRAILSILKE